MNPKKYPYSNESLTAADGPHVVHYRESPDELQWDKEFPNKSEADRFAYQVYINGGIAIVTPAISNIVVHPSQAKEQDHGEEF